MRVTFVPRIENGINTERVEVFFDDMLLAVVHVEEFYTHKNEVSDKSAIYHDLSNGHKVVRLLVEVEDATTET